MNEGRLMNRGIRIGAFTLGAGAIAFAFTLGSSQMGCGGGSGSGGTGNSTGGTGTPGTSGTGGTDSAGSTGTGGTGGSGSGACRNDFIEVATDISTDTNWACNSYVLKQKIHIDGGASIATLTIAAGSTIYGDGSPTSPAALISTRNGRLVAVGTATSPITFTSYAPVGQRTPGDTFAGVVLLGKASINSGTCIGDADTSTAACDAPGYFQQVIEGIPANDTRGQYGGLDDTWNCGDLTYVRIQFAGYIIGANNELNGLTMGGCGTQTHISYVHVHQGFDDGIEIFGGTVGMDHIVLTGNTDDQLDWDQGWRGKVQFLIAQEAYGRGDKGFEADNYVSTETVSPRANPEIWNATVIGQNPNQTIGLHLRRGTWYKLRNFIVYGFGNATSGGSLDVDATADDNNPNVDWPTKISIESSVFFGGPLAQMELPPRPAADGSCTVPPIVMAPNVPSNDKCFDEAGALMDPARMNITTMDPMFQAGLNVAVIPSQPSYIPGNAGAVTGKATPPAPFDTTATYAGAVDPATTPGSAWYDGWTEFPEK